MLEAGGPVPSCCSSSSPCRATCAARRRLRARAQLLPAASPPLPGVVTIHDLAFEDHPEDFSRRTGWKYRAFTPRAARSAERVICVSEHTRDESASATA